MMVMVLFCLPTFPVELKITFMVVLLPAAMISSCGLTAVQPQLAFTFRMISSDPPLLLIVKVS